MIGNHDTPGLLCSSKSLLFLFYAGDFQWPKMKLSAEEWHENTKHWLTPDDDHVLYIATDENDRSWFGK